MIVKARREAVNAGKKTMAVCAALAVMLAASSLLLLWPGGARAGANYMVTNTADTGDNSLRWAIEQANANPGADNIVFSIPGDGPFTITPTSALPAITGPVTINGYSQDGSSPASGATPAVLMIEINGASAGNVDGLVFGGGSAGSVVKGLAINGFQESGVFIDEEDSITVEGNHIGTNIGGTASAGNTFGVHINTGSYCTIGGDTAGKRNVISGNGDNGVLIASGSSNNLQGNFIGTNASGTGAAGNGDFGVLISNSTGNTIGGDTAGKRNVISGNPGGLRIISGSANYLQGDYIGTNASGTAAVSNAYDGVRLTNTTGNTIGGDTAGKRNVISGNGSDGIYLEDADNNNTVQGNYIGTNASGTVALGNAYYGIEVSNSTGNTIGGDTASLGNVISGNGRYGVYICQNSISTNVQGNLVGTNAGGTVAVGNTWGGVAVSSSAGITIGGDTAGKRNVISGNTNNGINFFGGSNNYVQGNFIGTNASGTLPLGNTGKGVSIDGSTGNTIGGDTVAKRNIISSNADCGIYINGGSNNHVQGNYIGTDAGGTVDLGNYTVGVYFKGTTDCDVTGNRIWNNHDAGVFLYDKDSYGIRISLNSIYNNNTLGIDLSGVGANDGDNNNTNQPNRGYDHPVFSAAQYTVINGAGTVSGTAPPNAWVELYKTGPSPDPSGNGEGLTWLATVQAGGSGAFSAALTGLEQDDHISALAISPTGDPSGDGNTSEFAANVLIQVIILPVPAITGFTPTQGAAGREVTITGTGFGDTRGTSLVKFGTIKATEYTSWSDTEIKVKVPAPASRKGKLTVTTLGGVSNVVYFKVKPTVNDVTPTQGTAGTVITITGTGFGSTRGVSYVNFGGVKATVYPSWSNTSITVKVPSGASGEGDLVLVTSGGGSVPITFKVKPNITGLSPTSGAPGTEVTISGTCFGATRGTSTVKFGTTTVTDYVSWSNTVVKVKVPATAPGTKQVKVTTSGGTSAGVNFTVN